MEIIAATSDEVRELMNDILEHDVARQRRQELSEESFKEWLYDTMRRIVAKLGYTLQKFEDFWEDLGINISNGWHEGREQARKEDELKRKIRERKYR